MAIPRGYLIGELTDSGCSEEEIAAAVAAELAKGGWVQVPQECAVPALGEPARDMHGGCRLADTAFLIADRDDNPAPGCFKSIHVRLRDAFVGVTR